MFYDTNAETFTNNYYLCYETKSGPTWEVIDGEDAMQQRVDEICKQHGLASEDVHVFSEDDELLDSDDEPHDE